MSEEDRPGRHLALRGPRYSGYDIGYGKPPAQHRFKKGQSGNPSGKRKGALNVMSLLEQALLDLVVVNEGGQRSTISKGEALIKLMVNQATSGDARAPAAAQAARCPAAGSRSRAH